MHITQIESVQWHAGLILRKQFVTKIAFADHIYLSLSLPLAWLIWTKMQASIIGPEREGGGSLKY